MLTVIQFWHKGLLARIVAGLMALYLFDISVDFHHQRVIEENITVNEIESMSELVLEEIADIEDLFKEIPESDREPITKVSFSLVYLLPQQFRLQLVIQLTERKFQIAHEYALYSVPFSILTPPPRQA